MEFIRILQSPLSMSSAPRESMGLRLGKHHWNEAAEEDYGVPYALGHLHKSGSGPNREAGQQHIVVSSG